MYQSRRVRLTRSSIWVVTLAVTAALLPLVTSDPAEASPAAIRAEVSCDAAVNNPHFSRGALSVIFKTRITCRGDGPPVQVRVRGSLGSVAGGSPGSPAQGPPVVRATSDEIQTVPMGATITFYTPELGSSQVRGSRTYQGNIVGEIVGPPGVVSPGPNRAGSNSVFIVDPG